MKITDWADSSDKTNAITMMEQLQIPCDWCQDVLCDGFCANSSKKVE